MSAKRGGLLLGYRRIPASPDAHLLRERLGQLLLRDGDQSQEQFDLVLRVLGTAVWGTGPITTIWSDGIWQTYSPFRDPGRVTSSTASSRCAGCRPTACSNTREAAPAASCSSRFYGRSE